MNKIIIHEVGLRDGLQMEKQIVPTEKKIEWLKTLTKSNIDIIQAGSFVHPEKVPQMADTDEIFNYIYKNNLKPDKVTLSGLVLNKRGLERALECGVELICAGVSASETHSMKNTGMSVSEATEQVIGIAHKALAREKRIQVSVQSAFGCGFEGYIPPKKVLKIVEQFLDAGIKTISLADTAGHGTPDKVEKLFSAVFGFDDTVECACHFHNTYGMALVNSFVAMKVGVKYFESSFAGIGGCPFTKNPGGNLCTEDLVNFLNHMNIRKDIKIDNIINIANDASHFFKQDFSGIVYKNGPLPEFVK